MEKPCLKKRKRKNKRGTRWKIDYSEQRTSPGRQTCSYCVTKASPEFDLEVPSLRSREPKINCNIYLRVSKFLEGIGEIEH